MSRMRLFPFVCLLACTGKDELDCPEGMVRNYAGDCVLPGGSDTDTPGPEDTGDTDTGSGEQYDVCPEDAPYASIQQAIDAAASGDVITICPETFNETLVVDKPITLQGNADGATTRVDARGDGVTLSVTPAADGAVLANLVLRNGDAGPADSSGGFGGGLRIDTASITAQHIQIEDGIAAQGGGGLAVLNSNSVLEDITVLSGRAEEMGGGVYVSGGSPVMHRLWVQTSFAGKGAGLYATQTPLQVHGAIFFQNDARESVSSVLVEEGEGIVLANVVVALGTGGEDGCALDTEDGATLTNAIAFNNEGIGLCVGSSSTHNASYANTVSGFRIDGIDGPGETDLTDDPFFSGAPHGDFVLRTNSPCIDAGNPDSAYTDRDGSTADMGAHGGPQGFE